VQHGAQASGRQMGQQPGGGDCGVGGETSRQRGPGLGGVQDLAVAREALTRLARVSASNSAVTSAAARWWVTGQFSVATRWSVLGLPSTRRQGPEKVSAS